ncbi:hypothetical protein HPP92_015123, partial [Vanilla planifolia]
YLQNIQIILLQQFIIQGIVWFLEPERVPKVSSFTSQLRGPKEMKKKKGIIEVQPIKKYAKIKDRFLILSDPDGAEVDIKLMNYNIFAVSASNVLTKKWAKRYPIRLESKGSGVHDGNKTFYLYLDNAWEKESWCKALRLASFHDNKMINWYDQLSKEFNQYMTSFSSEFPSFLKPSAFSGEGVEKNIRVDGPSASSKVRVLLKKLAKRASKGGIESRPYSVLSSSREERKSETSFSSSDGSVKSTLEDKSSSFMLQDPVHLGSKVQSPVMPDAVWDDKLFGDDGTLCWNLLLSRFFFDAKRSAEMNNFVKSRIQKTLSNMRTPSYIGEIACTNIDLGNLPPYIHKIRVLPMDLTEVWTVEVDIEYLGGILLEIETRIEVCETELQEEFMNDSSELNCNVDASSLLEGIEYYSNQLKSSSNSADHSEKGNEGGEVDGLQQFKGATQAQVGRSKWKNILHTIAEQVSQVPLSLGIRIASLRGTLRFHVKAPPSNMLWFGFTSMPEIGWQLESSIGERKITSSHIALLMGNRFKAAIRDNLVLPNCDYICIPWMLAEKDDWVPREVAPFVWIKQEAMDTNMQEVDLNNPPGHSKTKPKSTNETKPSSLDLVDRTEKIKDVVYVHQPPDDPSLKAVSSSSPGDTMSGNSHASSPAITSELTMPLLRTEGTQESNNQSRVESSRATSFGDELASVSSEEDAKPKRIGRRARMMDLGRKMGEKLEEKRRHIEEKSRHIVEKMRENSKP